MVRFFVVKSFHTPRRKPKPSSTQGGSIAATLWSTWAILEKKEKKDISHVVVRSRQDSPKHKIIKNQNALWTPLRYRLALRSNMVYLSLGRISSSRGISSSQRARAGSACPRRASAPPTVSTTASTARIRSRCRRFWNLDMRHGVFHRSPLLSGFVRRKGPNIVCFVCVYVCVCVVLIVVVGVVGWCLRGWWWWSTTTTTSLANSQIWDLMMDKAIPTLRSGGAGAARRGCCSALRREPPNR